MLSRVTSLRVLDGTQVTSGEVRAAVAALEEEDAAASASASASDGGGSSPGGEQGFGVWARASAFLERYVGGLKEQNSLLAMEQRQQQLAEELVAAAANGGGGATLEQLLGMESMPLAGAATATSQRFGSTTVALEAPSASSSSSSAAVARGGKPSGGSLDRIYDASSELTLGTSMTFAGGGSALMRDRRRTKSGKNDKEHASLQQQETAQPLPERISEEDDGVESLSLLQTLDTLAEQ